MGYKYFKATIGTRLDSTFKIVYDLTSSLLDFNNTASIYDISAYTYSPAVNVTYDELTEEGAAIVRTNDDISQLKIEDENGYCLDCTSNVFQTAPYSPQLILSTDQGQYITASFNEYPNWSGFIEEYTSSAPASTTTFDYPFVSGSTYNIAVFIGWTDPNVTGGVALNISDNTNYEYEANNNDVSREGFYFNWTSDGTSLTIESLVAE